MIAWFLLHSIYLYYLFILLNRTNPLVKKVSIKRGDKTLTDYKSTPPIRRDLFRRDVWNGPISRNRLERDFFQNQFSKAFWARLNNL